jgi:DNA-binding transcriptional LysR family regulator
MFRRVARGVQPTPAGRTAVDLARDVLARLDVLEARLGAFTTPDAGHLRLSAFAGANAYVTPEAVRRYSRARPGVALSLVGADPVGPLAAVRDGLVDVALVTSWQLYRDPRLAKEDPSAPPLDADGLDGVDLVPLLDEQLHVALPADHRLARRARVALAELREEHWIEGGYPDCLGPIPLLAEALGGPPRIRFFCEDWNGKQALVADHAGIMIASSLTRAALRPDVVLRPTSPALPTRRLYAATAAPPFRLPAATAMIDVLVEVCGEQAGGTR